MFSFILAGLVSPPGTCKLKHDMYLPLYISYCYYPGKHGKSSGDEGKARKLKDHTHVDVTS